MGSPRVNALEEYKALLERQRTRPLGPDDEQRLELLRDVLLELGALPPEGSPLPPRPARADAVLELTFATQDDVVRAYSKNIGTGGLAIRTPRALPVGSTLELRITLPDASQTLRAEGQVVWSREDGMGVAFTQLPPEAERRLKSFLTQDASLLQRVRSVLKTDVMGLLKTDVRELGKGPAPQAATAVELDTRVPILVRLSDARLMTLVTELFHQKGLRVVTDSDRPAPIIVVDTGSALDVLSTAGRPGSRTIMVNVSGPDSLMGRLSNLSPAAFVKHPATAASVLLAVEKLLTATKPS
ncbi:TIGR02266 family protein [Myxococcus llanfairpwllgwyngyllgogerychwyrndrobwllllantysiliogogogochensis]|uniref:TIGR02266 family protein n=1 Tax=Myxococcus llanfairpwllgwyngyllgogerychwyrndrobwllllantysiliogogogochensis TaxID=2590453 RepID=A0A540WVL8_9BACT|nr:TIGR02266 family protein [Myxococcus llanfairpwllgwyngyllgogerychwyrndrobwllllantysiliogogogochensis]TQF13062.1 TIGR02266 family protein [Myxococcus llanfairpwllgwyngyllgogerychwyrndrobwllllantysiliogogogochensis]